METPLSGVMHKLNRAETHLRDLKDAVECFGKSDFYELPTELDYKRRPVARFRSVQPVDPDISILVGDCVHNFRCALDHLAYALKTAHTPNLPRAWARSSGFPLSRTRDDFRQRGRGSPRWKMRGMSRTARGAIERCQPYHRRKDPLLWSLYMLEELWAIDKHRLLHLTAAVPIGAQVWAEGLNGQRIGIRQYTRPIKDGAPFAMILGELPNPSQVQVHAEIEADVIFDERTDARSVRDRSVVGVLNGIRAAIGNYVLPQLGPELRRLFPELRVGYHETPRPVTASSP